MSMFPYCSDASPLFRVEPSGVRWLAPGLRKCKCVFTLIRGNKASLNCDITDTGLWCHYQTDDRLITAAVLYLSLHQIPVNSQSTKIQLTKWSNSLKTTGRQQKWKRISHILFIQTDLTTLNSFCVILVWLVAATGRLSGKDGLTYQWVTKESAGMEKMMPVCLGGMIIPGEWPAPVVVIMSVTMTEKQPSPPPPLTLRE